MGPRIAAVTAAVLAVAALLFWLAGDRDPDGEAAASTRQPAPAEDVVGGRLGNPDTGDRRPAAMAIEEPSPVRTAAASQSVPTLAPFDQPGALLTGVLLEHDGRPVPGAVLRASVMPDPYSSFIYLSLEEPPPPEAEAFDAVVTDAEGRFDLHLAEATARAGFGHHLNAQTADGRSEALPMPRVIAGERSDGLVLRLSPSRRLDIELTGGLALDRLVRDRHVDPEHGRWDPWTRGLLGAKVRLVDAEGRLRESRAYRSAEQTMTVWLAPTDSLPVEVELTLTGHEPARGPVRGSGDGSLVARLAPLPKGELILTLRSPVSQHREGLVKLEVRGDRIGADGAAQDIWGTELHVDLSDLPYDVFVARDREPVDQIDVLAPTPTGLRVELLRFDPVQDPGPHAIDIPLLETWQQPDPEEQARRRASGFDVSPQRVTVTATVVDALTREPIPGVTLVRSGMGGALTIERPSSAPSDASGRVVGGGLPQDLETTVGFQAEGFVLATVQVPALPAGADHDLGVVALDPTPPAFKVRVLDEQGRPAIDLPVRMGSLDRRTDEQGRASFPDQATWVAPVVEVGDAGEHRYFGVRAGDEVNELRLVATRLVELRLEGGEARACNLAPLRVLDVSVQWVPALEHFAAPLVESPPGDRWVLMEVPVGAYRVYRPYAGGEPAEFTVEPGEGRQVVTIASDI